MATILSSTDFVGLYKIDLSVPSVKTDFETNLLPEIEAKYLRSLLGDVLMTEFLAGLESEPAPATKWTDLLNGSSFLMQHCNKEYTLRFCGVKEILKRFVWCEFMNNVQVEYSATGAKLNNSDNSTNTTELKKAVDMYNNTVYNLYGSNELGFFEGADGIENFQYYSKLRKSASLNYMYLGTAYNFIFSKEKLIAGTYSNWCFTPLMYVHEF